MKNLIKAELVKALTIVKATFKPEPLAYALVCWFVAFNWVAPVQGNGIGYTILLTVVTTVLGNIAVGSVIYSLTLFYRYLESVTE